MAESIILPMPNEPFEDDIVVASCWQNDDPEPGERVSATLLLLRPQADHYSVVEVEWTGESWERTYALAFPNIIPAAAEYADMIGGY